jgi:hypothetical protein
MRRLRPVEGLGSRSSPWLAAAPHVALDGREGDPEEFRDPRPGQGAIDGFEHPQPEVLRVGIHGLRSNRGQSIYKPL